MTSSVFAKWLRDSRRSILGWAIALAVVGVGYAAFWPTIDNPEMRQVLQNYPQALLEALNYTDLATAAGYLNATVYGLLVGVLLLVYAVVTGTRLIAGDEDAGTLDLILAHPVSRTSLAVQRFGAFAVSVLVLSTALWLGMIAIRGPARLDGISVADLTAMHVHVVGFGLLFGAITFAVGAVTGRRALTLAVGSAVGLFAYAASGLLPQVAALAWVKDYSAFTWLNGSAPLRNGVDVGQVAIMLGLTLALVALGIWGFRRRDIAA
jgi:beta-exotoxin I transport system permease protein